MAGPQQVPGASVDSGLAPLHNIQHTAYRCRDAEQTRWFYEDILGLPLSAVFDFGRTEADATEVRYVHLFFELGDGNHIAFFDEPAHARPEQFDKKHGFDLHIAFEVPTMAELDRWRARLADAGVPVSAIDHDFLNSVYFYDPNGLRLELTVKTDRYDPIMRESAGDARATMARWTEETRPLKLERLGAASLEKKPLSVELPSL